MTLNTGEMMPEKSALNYKNNYISTYIKTENSILNSNNIHNITVITVSNKCSLVCNFKLLNGSIYSTNTTTSYSLPYNYVLASLVVEQFVMCNSQKSN